jgi:hypothetical protein
MSQSKGAREFILAYNPKQNLPKEIVTYLGRRTEYYHIV